MTLKNFFSGSYSINVAFWIFKRLEKAHEEKRTVAGEKKNLEEKMRDEIEGAHEEANRLHKLRDGAVVNSPVFGMQKKSLNR